MTCFSRSQSPSAFRGLANGEISAVGVGVFVENARFCGPSRVVRSSHVSDYRAESALSSGGHAGLAPRRGIRLRDILMMINRGGSIHAVGDQQRSEITISSSAASLRVVVCAASANRRNLKAGSRNRRQANRVGQDKTSHRNSASRPKRCASVSSQLPAISRAVSRPAGQSWRSR